MTITEWFIFFLVVQVVHFAGTWKMYEAAGRKRWEAIVPIYNAIVLMKIINRPTWYTILLFIPIVNLLMFPVVWVETLRSFGKNTTKDTLLGLFTFGFYLYYVNYTQPLQHIPDRSLAPKSKVGDTVSSLLFAVIVATIVHGYVLQPFQIPTSSLEKTLLVGDYLFVSKFHYGARPPMTAVAFPMVHDTIPIINKRSYSKWPQLPYMRLPALQKIERNDIVVFNWPVDTVYKFFDRTPGARANKPIDKKSNYVKRCVGIPGDNLSIKDGIVFINGKESIMPDRAKPQYTYFVALDGKTPIDLENLFKSMNITDGAGMNQTRDTVFIKALTFEGANRLRNVPGIKAVTRYIAKQADPGIFPQTGKWSADNFGPIYIPEAGKTVPLNAETLPFYKMVISDYEKNDLKVSGNEIRINGKVATSYTFKQDYYWMMGDNRHNSEDSRYWGFVPEDHIVGKPVFIWLSRDLVNGGIRWDRMFTTVGGSGQPYSYFKFFLIAMAAYFGITFFMKKKEKKS